nr:phage tail sheath subtilisin-like domain-containing protein [uncultured Ralstonia sp.]
MSGVSFQHIPSNLRVPLFYAEMDNSLANMGGQALNALLIGQMLPSGSATPNKPVLVTDPKSALTLFGQGSMLARMVATYRLQDAGSCNLWCIPLQDDPAASPAYGTITVSGYANAAGAIALYIAGQRVNVGVQLGDNPNSIAANIAAAIDAANDLPVTASIGAANAFAGYAAARVAASAVEGGAVVTLTSKWRGQTANDITVQDSFLGWSAGESIPAGLSLAYSAPTLTGGSTDPTLAATAIPAMGDDPYDFILHPYAQAQALNDLQLELNDSTGRWSYAKQIYGHAYTALRGMLSDLVAFGMTRNGQHHTVAAIDADCPNPCWEYVAAYGGANAVDIAADPARPTQTTPLLGMLAPRAGNRFLFEDRQALLNYGIATSYVSGGQLRVERAITTYQQNAFGAPDTSYLDSETLHTSAYVLRTLKGVITSKYPRHKLADDGTRFAAGQAIVTPSVIKGELCAAYGQMEYLGIVENLDTFKHYLIVERDTTDPNRVNVLFPPDYVNQLRVFAVLNQFRLQYPANQIVS